MYKQKSKKPKSKKERPNILDEETFGYYSRIAKTFESNDFENKEDKERFVCNILKSVCKEALQVSKEPMVSKLIENVLPFAKIENFHAILKNFSQDWETACCDRFASFVTQALVRHLVRFLRDYKIHNDETASVDCAKLQQEIVEMFVDGLIKFLLSKLAFYMQHFSTSHIVRVVIETLAEAKVDDKVISGRKKFPDNHKLQPQVSISMCQNIKKQFVKILLQFCQSISGLPKLEDHVCNSLSNPVLQTVVLCLKSLSLADSIKIMDELIKNTHVFKKENEAKIPALCEHQVASHFAEQVIVCLPDEKFEIVFNDVFKDQLSSMAESPVSNFVVRRLIESARTKVQFKLMYKEVCTRFENILAHNHMEIIVKLAEGCVKHDCKQANFLKHISQSFHCYEPEERRCKLVQLLLSFSTYEVFYNVQQGEKDGLNEEMDDKKVEQEDDVNSDDDDDKSKVDEEDVDLAGIMPHLQGVNIHGSLIVQNLLNFDNPTSVVSSFFDLSKEELLLLCKNACGSRVVEAFVKSKTIAPKSKESLYGKLAGHYMELACDMWGSRTFDALWLNAKEKEKKVILDELNKNPNKLRGNKFGFFVYNKCIAAGQKRKCGSDPSSAKKLKAK